MRENIIHSSFIIHHSSFIIHHSSVISHHSSFIIHHSSFIIHHSIIHHSSFIIHHSSFIILTCHHDLNRQALAPSMLFASETLSRLPRRAITLFIQRAGSRLMSFVAKSHLHTRVVLNVLHPLRVVKMLGQNIKLAVRFDEPYLDLTRQAAVASHRRQVEILDRRRFFSTPQRHFKILKRATFPALSS